MRITSYRVALALYAFSRLVLIHFNEAEFTDGYQLITWTLEYPVRWHPLYPLALKPLMLFLDPVLAGRLISIACGLATLVILKKIVEQLYTKESATMVAWLYVVSPLIYWTNLRVLTESMFQLLTFASVLFFLRSVSQKNSLNSPAFLFVSGFAFLTRPEGILFLPFAIWILFHEFQRKRLRAATAMISWLVCFYWLIVLKPADSYSEVMILNVVDFEWLQAVTFLIAYVEVYPYILFYPVFVLVLLRDWRQIQPTWKVLVIYFHSAFAVILFVHTAWSTRFLMIPMTFLLVEASVALARRGWKFRAAILSMCFAFAIVAIFLQKEMFADFKSSAVAIRDVGAKRIVSDELAKTSLYSGREVVSYKEARPLQTGDVVVLHSFHTNLAGEKAILDQRYIYTVLYSTEASTIPLLGNLPLAKMYRTNSPVALFQRFERQHFQSVVLVIEGPK